MQTIQQLIKDGIRWGVYDARDKCWMGNDQGPLIYVGEFKGVSAHDRALCVATIINEQFKSGARFRAMPIPDGINKKRDTVEATLSFSEALDRLTR